MRPKKDTVDYFPHFCKQGDTLLIIQAQWGNNGYAFWFKLLEMLGTTEGHYIDINNPVKLELMAARVKLETETCKDILSKLADLESIDKNLFKEGIIWSQNFVDNLSTLYRNRGRELPKPPSFRYENTKGSDVSVTKSTHSIVEESIVKKKKTMWIQKFPPEFQEHEAFCEQWESYEAHRKQKRSGLTDEAVKRIVKKLVPLGPEVAATWINSSIEKGWTGIFEPGGKKKGDNGSGPSDEKRDEIKRSIRTHNETITRAEHDLNFLEGLEEHELTDKLRDEMKRHKGTIKHYKKEIEKLEGNAD